MNKPYPMFEHFCEMHGLPRPVREHRFHPTRKWRFDFSWEVWTVTFHGVRFISKRVAIEIDGGAWSRGRHTRGKGFIEDMAKMNEAQLAGWIVLRCTPQQVDDGSIFETLRRALNKVA